MKWIKRHPRITFSNDETFHRDFYSKFRFTFFLSIFLHCFKIPRTKSLSSLFEFLSIKISPSHSLSLFLSISLSLSICPAFNFVFIGLSVNRTAFEQGVQREQKRAFTVVPLMRSPDATVFGDRRIFSIIPGVLVFRAVFMILLQECRGWLRNTRPRKISSRDLEL